MTLVVSRQEKRAEGRLYPAHYLRVYHRMTDHLLGQLLDVSPNGLRILSDLPIVIGKSFELTIVPPECLAYPAHLNVRAKALWFWRDEAPGYYLVGFSLLKKPNDFFERIQGYVAEESDQHSPISLVQA